MTASTAQVPRFEAIDHLHIHVADRTAAEAWYARVLGLHRVPELAHWAQDGGPLTLADSAHTLHLAVFERPTAGPAHATLALRVTAEGLADWEAHLARELGASPRRVDHGESVSLYFRDPDGNPFEITHYGVTGSTAALHALLTQELDHAVEHGATPDGGAMSTHLPMALHALAALGAPARRLRTWAGRHFPDVPSAPPWPELARRESDLRAALQRDGAEAVLARHLPALMPHAGAAAFHALIRTAHAWEAAHEAQLARALAYWSLREMPWPAPASPPAEPTASATPLDLPGWSQALLALPRRGPEAPWIVLRMRDALQRPDFQAVAPRLRLPGDAMAQLRQLGRWAAGAYADSGNFTLLHGLTATRATTRLLPLLPHKRHADVLAGFVVQLGAALVASRWTGQPLPAPAPAAWAPLRQAAIAHDDEHAIKAVHAAWDLQQLDPDDPDPVWRQAAARALASFG